MGGWGLRLAQHYPRELLGVNPRLVVGQRRWFLWYNHTHSVFQTYRHDKSSTNRIFPVWKLDHSKMDGSILVQSNSKPPDRYILPYPHSMEVEIRKNIVLRPAQYVQNSYRRIFHRRNHLCRPLPTQNDRLVKVFWYSHRYSIYLDHCNYNWAQPPHRQLVDSSAANK